MRASEGRSPAPDLFTALGLVPFAGEAASGSKSPAAAAAPPRAPASGGNGAHPGGLAAPPPVAAAVARAPASVGRRPGFGGLADLLEPGAVDEADEADTSELPRPGPPPSTSAVDDIDAVLSELDIAVDDDVEPAPAAPERSEGRTDRRAAPERSEGRTDRRAAPERSEGRTDRRVVAVPPVAPARAPAARPQPVHRAAASGTGLPDFPAPQAARSGPVPVVDPSAALSIPAVLDPRAATSAPVVAAPSFGGSALADPNPSVLLDDDEIAPRRSAPWLWIVLTVMLAAGLGYVLWSQTDLLSGVNPIEARKAEVTAEVAQEAAAIEAERARDVKEYGTLSIATTPEGARVWLVEDGPEAIFENLPVGNEYQVLVAAKGHAPRIRVLKGSELAAPVIMDLDPLDDPEAFVPIPEAPAPALDETPKQDTATLTLRSNTEGAKLALMVGYTPGAKVIDLDVEQTHRVWVTLAGYALHELELKGRHWEETPDGALMYMESIELTPYEEPELVIEDTEGAVTEGTGGPQAAEAPPPPNKKKKKKRRRRRKKR